ncbi:hypothetical protein N5P32_02390 [Marinomonas pontica]|uniref:hypothetical protein n=1 Tax=Marinomonas pontica TaxID=264739 RepID=UPI002243C808|nr:hypothetical protein [Marinomonas pontica]MCW8354824.1 hypothetical protein [Marinomonas pontica]
MIKKVNVLFLIFNDHITSFFFDHYSPFTLGVDDSYQTADEVVVLETIRQLLAMWPYRVILHNL